MTVREVYRSILDASVQSAVVTGIEVLLLDDPETSFESFLRHVENNKETWGRR